MAKIMQKMIAVCGGKKAGRKALKSCEELGRAIALGGFHLVTGATIGASHAAAQGARKAGGKTLGISPAKSAEEHVLEYGYPVEGFDEIIFTGKGFVGRNIELVKASDAVVFASGGIGTLNEFTLAIMMKKPIGILSGTGGFSSSAKAIMKSIGEKYAKVCYSRKPAKIIQKLRKWIRGMMV
ncbi:MAG: LOG family protein [Candidatus Diapherotrites archaeon]|uniref:LOG family protein n=1 Tax=Candidatus Iainarchaeum sp. TaxID=3101447 RepID=A0A8T3YQM9_9ARCH|nr:LOG family protein [Candidatus Diapherotrites archaeon]